MCSIHGIYRKNSHYSQTQQFEFIMNMLQQSQFRGPDFTGLKQISDRLIFASNRLSIQDTSSNAIMPFYHKKNGNWIVFNGEIYNISDIRNQLLSLGYTFTSQSDTEVVLYSFDCWGVDCLNLFNGIFAFAIWDNSKKNIFLARDRYGIKPLYYTNNNNIFCFGSELKNIVTISNNFIDTASFTAYMIFRFVPSYKTIYKDIYKLNVGEYLIFDTNNNTINKHKYWKPLISQNSLTDKENETLFFEKLHQSILESTIGDVPYGVLLSGGIDSSAIVASLANSGIKEIQTFSCAYEKSNIIDEPDEIEFANIIAKKFNTNHNIVTLCKADIENFFDKMVYSLDEPLASQDALSHYIFAQKMDSNVKYLLSGTGADKLLGGYFELFFGLSGKKLKHIKNSIDFLQLVSCDSSPINNILSLINPDYLDTSYYTHELTKVLSDDKFNFVDEIMSAYVKFLFAFDLPDWELLQTDRVYMSNSFEVRPVFLNNNLVDFALTLPAKFKYNGKTGKPILYNSFNKILPKKILNRKKYPSLTTPKMWYKTDWFKNKILETSSNLSDFWNKRKVYDILSSENFDLAYRIIHFETWHKLNCR